MPGVEPAFTENLRQVFAPALKDAGFTFDGRRVFHRRVAACTQIVELQIGERSMQGTFAVNLAVYDPQSDSRDVDPAGVREFHCDWTRRQRLGMLLPPRFPALQRLPLVGMFFGPKDKWWSAHSTEGLREARDLFFKHGVIWLEQHTRGFSSLPRP